MASELRKLIFETADIPEEVVSIPEWDNVKVLVLGMNGKQRAKFLERSTGPNGEISFDRFYTELVIATAHDPETREAIFEGADRDALNAKSGRALERIAMVAQRLSGLGVGDVEEAKKDLEGTESSAST